MSSEFFIRGWIVQPERNRLVHDGREVKVEPKAMKVLVHLAECSGEVATKPSLLAAVWEGSHVSEEVLTNCIWELRRAFGDSAKSPRYIETVPKSGYRLIPPAELPNGAREISTPGVFPSGATVSPASRPSFRALGILVLAVAAGVAGWRMLASAPNAPALVAEAEPIRSVAVLPLKNLSGDSEQEYLAAAMTEALIGDLAKIGSLHVTSHTSVIQYKESDKPVPEIARELNVEGILEGAVIRDGDRVRVTAQLIDARDDRHVWSQRYDREFSDVLALQSDVAREVAEQVRLELSPEERVALTRPRSVDSRAVDAYLRGLQMLQNRPRGPGGVGWSVSPLAVDQFEEAVKLDPDFAEAHASLAAAHIGVALWEDSERRREEFEKARESGRKALELDERLAVVHVSLGDVSLYHDWDFPAAGRAYERALRHSPNDPIVVNISARYLLLMGKTQEGLDISERLPIVAPFDLRFRAQRARHLFWARQYEKALEEFDRVRELWPDYEDPWLSMTYYSLGRPEDGYRADIAYYESCGAPCDWSRRAWERGWARGGRVEAMRTWLGDATMREGVPPGLIARGYAVVGDADEAFAWLERGYGKRGQGMLLLKVDPAWDGIRHDPRFDDLLRRIGLQS